MNKNILIVGLLVASFVLLVHSQSITDPAQDEWDEFKTTYSRSYENQVEEKHRMKVYLNNRKTIAMHNRNPNIRFKLRMNKFGDQTPQEFKSRMNGFSMELQANQTNGKRQMFMAPLNFVAPDEIDWREQGYVTPVKNQQQCGSCWAFSATGSLEGQHMRKTGQLVSLSEQNLIDCSSSQGNKGCNGGIMDNAFKYVEDNGGIDTEESYPYEGRDDTCRYSNDNIGATCIGYTDIPQGDENALMVAVASVGPVSVAIDASQDTFMYYHSGVYFDEKCSSRNLDHGVLVVGYGTENGQDYWLVKNSWGPEWGEEGYIKMARNAHNQCGIATLASYPIV